MPPVHTKLPQAKTSVEGGSRAFINFVVYIYESRVDCGTLGSCKVWGRFLVV
jgi:hypothetical protein